MYVWIAGCSKSGDEELESGDEEMDIDELDSDSDDEEPDDEEPDDGGGGDLPKEARGDAWSTTCAAIRQAADTPRTQRFTALRSFLRSPGQGFQISLPLDKGVSIAALYAVLEDGICCGVQVWSLTAATHLRKICSEKLAGKWKGITITCHLGTWAKQLETDSVDCAELVILLGKEEHRKGWDATNTHGDVYAGCFGTDNLANAHQSATGEPAPLHYR
jgi:hypothetical protein